MLTVARTALLEEAEAQGGHLRQGPEEAQRCEEEAQEHPLDDAVVDDLWHLGVGVSGVMERPK